MAEQNRSPGVGEGGGTQLEVRGFPQSGAWWASRLMVLVLFWLQAACATGAPMSGTLVGGSRHRWRLERSSPRAPEAVGSSQAVSARPTQEAREELADEAGESEEAGVEAHAAEPGVKAGAGGQGRRRARRTSLGDGDEDLEGGVAGWPDGVGDGRPFEVPMTLDYFQGFLAQAGIPSSALPKDGRTLAPQQAMELVPHLLATPLTLGNFGLRRMAAHLLFH